MHPFRSLKRTVLFTVEIGDDRDIGPEVTFQIEGHSK